ncbi:hypothetical protein HPB52_018114 [Rhipicephalus sanguineus]|uniref:Uncharacterized protein n=1 Tax=Rhipicephalus sanguineus TaxID=34632 RepID=A0A9D4SQK5_RHISA|nr:hypothetical protein HPB52_018114 [Rhipicephalus sanguineus]
MFTNVDIRGVERTRCSSSGCECDAFTRPSAVDTCVVQAASVQCGWCCYCGHSPVTHCRATGAPSMDVYTCKLFRVDVSSVRLSLASLLRENKYKTT